MGRILRITVSEDVPEGVDLGIIGPGKIFIQNDGLNDLFLGYDRSDVLAATAVNYFTIAPGITYVFDVSPSVGYLSQSQLMWFNANGGDSTLVVWVADSV